MKLAFSRQNFEKGTQILIFINIRLVGAERFHAGGQTDGHTDRHDDADSRCSQVCERT